MVMHWARFYSQVSNFQVYRLVSRRTIGNCCIPTVKNNDIQNAIQNCVYSCFFDTRISFKDPIPIQTKSYETNWPCTYMGKVSMLDGMRGTLICDNSLSPSRHCDMLLNDLHSVLRKPIHFTRRVVSAHLFVGFKVHKQVEILAIVESSRTIHQHQTSQT